MSAGLACVVSCGAESSCRSALVRCPPEASCELRCTEESACRAVFLVCGAGRCRSVCGEATVYGMVCAEACACERGCEEINPCELGVDCPDDPCFDVSCGRGDCVVVAGMRACVCSEGYEAVGLRCVRVVEPCEGVTCSNHGQCVVEDGAPRCECDAGFEVRRLAGVAAGACPPDPLPEDCPAACSGGCEGGTCVIACDEDFACDSAEIECPAGHACRISCAGLDSCQLAMLTCPPAASCEVRCINDGACDGAEVTCGGGPCLSVCAGRARLRDLACGEACACEDGC